MLFLTAFVRNTAKKLVHTPPTHIPIIHATPVQLLHATAPMLGRKGAPALAVDVTPGREIQAMQLFERKFEQEGFDKDVAKHEFFEKGAARRVRVKKESKVRIVNREFRERLMWCIKQRARYVLGWGGVCWWGGGRCLLVVQGVQGFVIISGAVSLMLLHMTHT